MWMIKMKKKKNIYIYISIYVCVCIKDLFDKNIKGLNQILKMCHINRCF